MPVKFLVQLLIFFTSDEVDAASESSRSSGEADTIPIGEHLEMGDKGVGCC